MYLTLQRWIVVLRKMLGPLLFFSWVISGQTFSCENAAPDTAHAAPAIAEWSRPAAPITATHYFARHWAPNFISGFRRSDVAGDFERIRKDGFNSVIFVVSWGDFQPGYDPCCSYDERSFERLHFLIKRAESAGLQVILRIGYMWTYSPEVGEVLFRTHRLMNRPETRAAYLAYIQRIVDEIRPYPHVVMSFMSWEDQSLRVIDEDAQPTVARWLMTLPADQRPSFPPLPIRHDGEQSTLFHRYWDWLAIEELYEPALSLMPNLAYEVRVDKEPVFGTLSDGTRSVIDWLSHTGMYRSPGHGGSIAIYWAPYWGARNVGERIHASEALASFEALLRETRQLVGDRPLFIDQLNFVDNSPGHDANASIEPREVDTFIDHALCTMKRHGVMGYGLWTGADYRESLLHNPAFGLGLEGWWLVRASGGDPHEALVPLPSGDFGLLLQTGDALSQTVSRERGRLPFEDDRPDEVCLRASVETPAAQVAATAGRTSGEAHLSFDSRSPVEVCAPILSRPDGDSVTLTLTVGEGSIMLLDVWFHDHVQYGGVYDVYGRPGPYRDAILRLNRNFIGRDLPAYCATQAALKKPR